MAEALWDGGPNAGKLYTSSAHTTVDVSSLQWLHAARACLRAGATLTAHGLAGLSLQALPHTPLRLPRLPPLPLLPPLLPPLLLPLLPPLPPLPLLPLPRLPLLPVPRLPLLLVLLLPPKNCGISQRLCCARKEDLGGGSGARAAQ